LGGGALALVGFLQAMNKRSKVVWDTEDSLWLTAFGMNVMMAL